MVEIGGRNINASLHQYGFKFRYADHPFQMPYCRTFYRIISDCIRDTPEHPNSARKRICELQENPDYRTFFEAFEPEEQYVVLPNGRPSYSVKDIFKNAIKLSLNNDELPRHRDIYAAAMYLHRELHVFSFTDNSDEQSMDFIRYGNLTIREDMEPPVLILKTNYNGSIVYAELVKTENHEDLKFAIAVPHASCHGVMFRKNIHFVNPAHHNQNDRMMLFYTTKDEFSLYRCIAKVIYGDERLHKYVQGLVEKYKAANTNLLSSVRDMLSKPSNNNQVKKTKMQKITEIEKYFSGKQSLRVVATIFTTDIYVLDSDGKAWSLFYPLHGFHGVRQTSSYVSLKELGNSQYDILSTCNCEVSKPYVNDILSDVYLDVVSDFIRKGRLNIH